MFYHGLFINPWAIFGSCPVTIEVGWNVIHFLWLNVACVGLSNRKRLYNAFQQLTLSNQLQYGTLLAGQDQESSIVASPDFDLFSFSLLHAIVVIVYK